MPKSGINIVKNKILTSLFCLGIFLIQSGIASASSFSSNYSVNDEALDFAASSEQLKGTNATMDLSSISWMGRIAESSSFKVIDSNSTFLQEGTPPVPGGASGGGVVIPPQPLGENDNAQLQTLPVEQKPNLKLNESPQEISTEVKPEEPGEPLVQPEPVKTTLAEDSDGCSIGFENKFMKTNPYDYDSDNDGIGDCDEQFVYGLKDDYTGLALFNDYIYSQSKPFFVGRADFGENTNNLQIQLDQMDPLNTLGLFFLKTKKDLNFAEYAEIDLENGRYQARLYSDGLMQNSADYFKVDNNLLYTKLKLDIPEDNKLSFKDKYIKLTGTSGENYGVVAIWQSDDFVDVSAVLADKKGNFKIYSPGSFEDGEYTVTLYGLIQEGDKIIQTNYQEMNFKVEEDKAAVINMVYADIAQVDYAAADIMNGLNTPSELHSVSNNKTSFPIMGLIAFVSFTLIGFYFLWKQKNI
jgi:hypothetical protein